MATSARVVTGVSAVALLFALFRSSVSLLTTALLTRMVPDGVPGSTLAVTVMVAFAPFARLPRLHVSGNAGLPGIPPMQEPWLGEKVTSLIWAGSVSFTTTLTAVDGPAFVSVMV